MEDKKSKKNNIFEEYLDKTLTFFLSNNPKKWLLLIVLLGLILRILLLSNIGPLADESVHGTHAINILKSGAINFQNECPAWFYLTGIGYEIFGISALTSRLLSLIFGTLSIIVLYLIGSYLFNKKIGLMASFILAISYFHIRFNLTTMDGSMMFFVLMMFYYFVKELNEKNKLSYLVILLAGVALLMKPIVLVFGVSMFIYLIFFVVKKSSIKRKEFFKENKIRLIFSVIILPLFSLPIVAYNYILYKQKGITDVLFSRFFSTGRGVYSSLQGFDQSWNFYDAFSFLPNAVSEYFLKLSPLIFILGILGIILIFSFRKFKNGRFFVLFYVLPFIFLLGSGQNQIHFVSFITLFSLTSSIFIVFMSEFISEKIKAFDKKKIILIFLAIILLINIILMLPNLASRSAMWNMREYAVDNFENKDIIVADARIYRGRIAWMFNEFPYIEASYFGDLMNANNNQQTSLKDTNIYFIECAVDDCGWGTIKDQPEFNQSMESLVSLFKNSTQIKKTIYGGGGYLEDSKSPYFNVYKITIPFNTKLYPEIEKTHEWFYYPVNWFHKDYYDYFYPQGGFQFILYFFGKMFLWIGIILAVVFMLLPFIELRKSNK